MLYHLKNALNFAGFVSHCFLAGCSVFLEVSDGRQTTPQKQQDTRKSMHPADRSLPHCDLNSNLFSHTHTHTHTHTHRHRALIGAGRWKEALNYKSWWSHKTSIKYPTYPLNTAFTLFHPIQPSISPCIHNYIHTHADTLCLYFNRITFKTFPLKQ